jgi:uncharacterized cupin superfamily protein
VNPARIVPDGQSSDAPWPPQAERVHLGGIGRGGAGSGNAHRFVNRSTEDAVLLVVGDRTPLDEVSCPDIDNHARGGADGRDLHTREDGTPHELRWPALS